MYLQDHFQDIHLRAIDREQMLKLILQGHGTIGNDNPIGPSYRYYVKELEKNPLGPPIVAGIGRGDAALLFVGQAEAIELATHVLDIPVG